MEIRDKMIAVMTYGMFRSEEWGLRNMKLMYGMANVLSGDTNVAVPGFRLFRKHNVPIAVRTANPEAKLICDIIFVSDNAYCHLQNHARNYSLHEEIILTEEGFCIIFVADQVELGWQIMEKGDWKDKNIHYNDVANRTVSTSILREHAKHLRIVAKEPSSIAKRYCDSKFPVTNDEDDEEDPYGRNVDDDDYDNTFDLSGHF